MENNKELETGFLNYDPIVLVRDVCKRWLQILVIAVLVGVAAYILTDLTYTPEYTANATMVVSARGSNNTVYSNLSTTTTLAKVYTELLNSSVFRKTVMQAGGIQSFSGRVTASQVGDTNLMTLQVTAPSAKMAYQMIRAILDHHEEMTYNVVGNVTLEVLQDPVVPTGPSNWNAAAYRMKQMTMIAAALAAAGFAALSYLSDKVRSSIEAQKKLNCHYLGDIPHEQKYKTLLSWLRHKKRGILLTNPITSFRFLENIRKLRRRVEQRMDGGKVLMVTSVLENEGKSTVAVNLALALAKKHKKVLLVDCDMRKPACNILMGRQLTGPGVISVLSGKTEAEQALLQEKQTGLYMLLEKKGTRHSGELITSSRMRELLQWARDNFDFVVLDLPPMSAVTDAERMVDLVDASILVVRQNACGTKQLNKALDALGDGKSQVLGCVLNNVYSTMLSAGQGYGYGYGNYRYGGYRYGHYGRYGQYGNYDQRNKEN